MTKRWWSREDDPASGDNAGGSGSTAWESTRCPTCGRAHPLRTDTSFEWFADDDLDQIELEGNEPLAGASAPGTEFEDAVVSDATIDLNPTPRWLPAALVIATVAGLAGLMIFSANGDTPESLIDDTTDLAAEPTTVAPTAVPTVDPAVAIAAELETQRQRHEVASIWARTLVPAAAAARVVYRTENSVAVVDLGAGEQRELGLDVPVDLSTEGFAYLASSRGTWVINPDRLDTALRLAPQAEISPLADPTASIVLPAPGARFLMLSQHDGRIVRPIVELPPTSEVRIVGGRGAIVSPPTGGSSLVTSVGAEPLTAGKVIAAAAEYLVELRCEPLVCRAVVRPWPTLQSDEGEVDADVVPESDASLEVELPGDVWTATSLALAPNGEWIFVSNQGGETWQLYDLRSGTAEVAGSGVDPGPNPPAAVVWAPDSSYFAFIDDDGLVVGDPDLPTALAKVPLQFPAALDLESSEMIVMSG